MVLNVTRGGLSPAKIINLNSNEEVRFMFNPFEFTLSKSNQWKNGEVMGLNVPKVDFQSGGAVSLKLTLHFDTQPNGGDVRYYTNPLWKMMMIDESKVTNESGKGQPPPVAFEWNRLYFKAIIKQMSQKFTLFSDKGVPLRCEVSVTLQQYVDEEDRRAQVDSLPPGQGASASTQVIEGQRIDHIAASSSGSASSYRSIAEKNNIDNPLNLPSGTNVET